MDVIFEIYDLFLSLFPPPFSIQFRNSSLSADFTLYAAFSLSHTQPGSVLSSSKRYKRYAITPLILLSRSQAHLEAEARLSLEMAPF